LADRFSLKDALFNQDKVIYLARLFGDADARFDATAFVADVMSEMLSLELKQRIDLIARVLARHLPKEFRDAVAVIMRALPQELDANKTDDDFGDFIFGPLGEFVATNGMAPDNLALSLAALKEITKRFSMEFALRRFLNAHEARVLDALAEWVNDQNYHVRRLVSEGTRPRLPWGVKVALEPRAPLVFLNRLYGDPTRYVTRSVANHLNDITKIDGPLVLDTLQRWRSEGGQDAQELRWITRHALRNLIKAGDPATMAFLGYATTPPVAAGPLVLAAPQVTIGAALAFKLTLAAQGSAHLLIDYVISFVKADGSQKPKVFKLKQLDLKQGETAVLSKAHRFKGDATTFRLYPGRHRLAVQINGVERAAAQFDLIAN
jgi:3-methyladenine DNA glycosylase AlkC